jgi:hypothetical protein
MYKQIICLLPVVAIAQAPIPNFFITTDSYYVIKTEWDRVEYPCVTPEDIRNQQELSAAFGIELDTSKLITRTEHENYRDTMTDSINSVLVFDFNMTDSIMTVRRLNDNFRAKYKIRNAYWDVDWKTSTNEKMEDSDCVFVIVYNNTDAKPFIDEAVCNFLVVDLELGIITTIYNKKESSTSYFDITYHASSIGEYNKTTKHRPINKLLCKTQNKHL